MVAFAENHAENLTEPQTCKAKTSYPRLTCEMTGQRFYHAETGRWINRDPLWTLGGAWRERLGYRGMGYDFAVEFASDMGVAAFNLYSFVRNSPTVGSDYLGLSDNDVPPIVISPPIRIDPRVPGMPPVRNDCVCPKGTNIGRASRPGWVPEAHVNGCGPAGTFGHIFIPEDPMITKPPYKTSCPFTPACNGHDACYGRCNMFKDGCDYQFLRDMKSACRQCADDNFPCGPLGGGCGAKYLWLAQCYSSAYTFYWAVSWYGNSPYQSAQDDACVDCCCP